MPETVLASAAVSPDGNRVLTPILSESRRPFYRVTLQGCFHSAYNDRDYDALYECDPTGSADTSQPHFCLDWTPVPAVLEHADPAAHRYVFRLPANGSDGSFGVRINIDRFVNTFLIPPSEVRNGMSGRLSMTVSEMEAAPTSPWATIGLASLPALLLVSGTGWILRRRMVMGGLDHELQTQIARTEQKVRKARSVVRREDARLVPVLSRLTAIQEGVYKLARHVQQLRRAQTSQDRPALERELKAMERQAERSAEPARREIQDTLIEKQKALALLDEMWEAENHYRLRLSKLEAVLDAAILNLQSLRVAETEVPAEWNICRALDAEVSALQEAAHHVPFGPLIHGLND